MNVNDLHHALGHANEKTLRATARQLGIKVTGSPEYCEACGEAKAIKSPVPKKLSPSRKSPRPLHRVSLDLAGAYPASTGGSKYLLMMLDAKTNYGWVTFLRDKTSGTVVDAFRSWHTSVKPLIEKHGAVEYAFMDNGNEFTNAEFRALLRDLNITAEFTSADGAKSNGHVERRIALAIEGGRAAWGGYPNLFPGVEFPTRAKSYQAM